MNTTNKQSFTKPFLTIEQQINQLKSRGMNFHDEEKAKYYLENLDLYIFDRELRLLLLDAIERIEVSIRSKLAYHLAESFGSHAHLKPEIFASPLNYARTLTKLKSELDRNRSEIFIKHHLDKYSEELPPIWVSVEVMTMGQIYQKS